VLPFDRDAANLYATIAIRRRSAGWPITMHRSQQSLCRAGPRWRPGMSLISRALDFRSSTLGRTVDDGRSQVLNCCVTVVDAPPLASLAIHLGRTKTPRADQDEVVYLTGRPVEPMNTWLAAARIEGGSIFRKVDRWGNVSKRALEPGAVNAVLKQRAEMAAWSRQSSQPTGLRSGYLREAAHRGIPLPEAMERSRHRSIQEASTYHIALDAGAAQRVGCFTD